MKLSGFKNAIAPDGRYGTALLLAGSSLAVTVTMLLVQLSTTAVMSAGPPLCEQESAVAGQATGRQAVWSVTGNAAGVSVRVEDLRLVSDRAEDQVFSLRPETEGNAPLSAGALLRRSGNAYA